MQKFIFNKFKKVSFFYLFLAFSFLILVFIKSELFLFNFEKVVQYKFHYLFSFLFIGVSLLTLIFSIKTNYNILVLLISIFISLILAEIFLKDYLFQYNKLDNSWDEFKKLKTKDINARPQTLPFDHLDDTNIKIFPLSSHKNSLILSCNENGYVQTYFSDRYGFNNPDYEWETKEVDYLIIGDSFAEGHCVNRPFDYASQLRIKNNNVITLGVGGNGPLIEYATLVEYGKLIKVKNIIWMYFEGNDVSDLIREVEHPILKSYINIPNFTQNLALKTNHIDNIANNNFLRWKDHNQRLDVITKTSFLTKTKKILSLTSLRLFIINNFLTKTKINTDEIIINKNHLNNFNEIIKLINNFSTQQQAKLYFVYLPSYLRYHLQLENDNDYKNYIEIKEFIKSKNIDFIDFYEIFKKKRDLLEDFYSSDKYVKHTARHFSEKGYSYLANETLNFIKKKNPE